MTEPVNFNHVADLYDYYVNVDFDIPFFLKETESCTGRILELMCGTGRVSLPLLEAGRKLTCVDYSAEMLKKFEQKIIQKNYDVEILQQDVVQLSLNRQFDLVIVPFHSFSEIPDAALQQKAIQSIAKHINRGGSLILTLQNPETRLKQADGSIRILGRFPAGKDQSMIIYTINKWEKDSHMVSGFQFYEIYNKQNILIEKRHLEISFRPVTDNEVRQWVSGSGLEITALFGDYQWNSFVASESNFMIYKMIKS